MPSCSACGRRAARDDSEFCAACAREFDAAADAERATEDRVVWRDLGHGWRDFGYGRRTAEIDIPLWPHPEDSAAAAQVDAEMYGVPIPDDLKPYTATTRRDQDLYERESER